MTFPTIPNPREQDHIIMDIFFASDLGPDIIKSLSRCRGAMRAIFLSDLSTADSKYLKHFVFNPGLARAGACRLSTQHGLEDDHSSFCLPTV